MISSRLLTINLVLETDRITSLLEETVHKRMRRYGAVVGVSGGVDSSVTLALCVRAFGPDHVLAIILPEKESDPDTHEIASLLANHYRVRYVLKDITSILSAFDCYKQRDEAIKRLFPEYDPAAGYKCKITLPSNLLDSDVLNFFSLSVIDSNEVEKSIRIPMREYLQIIAATNMKQRTRMVFLYHYGELNNYAVVGTTNKDEYDLGFFVKYGDGGVDIEPIAHLYKTQVFQLAEYLGVPEVIRNRPPSTDTYSAHHTQEEFFYRLPFDLLDTIMFAQDNCISIAETAALTGLSEVQVQRAWDDILRKKRATEYIRMDPQSLFIDERGD